jgi:phage terminase large subunit-like protein
MQAADLRKLRDNISSGGRDEVRKFLDSLSENEAAALLYQWPFWARPAEERDDGTWSGQVSPPTDWDTWLLLAGRGYGKTRTGAEFIRDQVMSGSAKSVAFIAQDPADARNIMIDGESGIRAVSPPSERPYYNGGKKILYWPNGAKGFVFSGHEPDGARGYQFDLGWCDELCAWKYAREVWDNYEFGLRLTGPDGSRPRTIITTTPKPSRLLSEIMKDDGTSITTGSTYDNISNLAPTFFKKVVRRYEGTTIGEQELHARILGEVQGALWTRETLAKTRVSPSEVPDFKRIVVAVDPMVRARERARKVAPPETGIIVAGVAMVGGEEHAYIISDETVTNAKPDLWARRVIAAFHDYKADRVLGEVNNGGDMVEDVIHTRDPTVPVKMVHASRGKTTRAEPVAALYEQGRAHHVGTFASLETQLTTWTGANGEPSPDRLDAAVWALTELLLGRTVPEIDIDPGFGLTTNQWQL